MTEVELNKAHRLAMAEAAGAPRQSRLARVDEMVAPDRLLKRSAAESG